MPEKVNVHEAKTHLSRILARVEKGEEIVISKSGRPVARLVPIKERPVVRIAGSAKGKVFMAEDFDAPLPEEIRELFEQ